MSEAQPCPHCGAPLPIELRTQSKSRSQAGLSDSSETDKGADPERDLDLPPVSLLAPGSHDDDFSSFDTRIRPAEPDPILGQFVTPSSGTFASKLLEARPPSSSTPSFPAIDLGSKIGTRSVPRHSKIEPGRSGVEDQDLEGGSQTEWTEEAEIVRRTSWGSVLLASYASAVTLGLAWTLMKDRSREKPERVTTPVPASSAPESPRQAGLSRKVGPNEPMVADHLATMGQPLKVGSLEVTPLDVKRQAVTLQQANPYAPPQRKEGGKGALSLRLRIKNTSSDEVFAPLDQAYIRERGKEVVDTYLMTPSHDRIYPFPLAVDSEWSIVGQEFGELRPGESRVVAIVSAPDAPPDTAGPFTWRVRLRTGINRTDAIGLVWPSK